MCRQLCVHTSVFTQVYPHVPHWHMCTQKHTCTGSFGGLSNETKGQPILCAESLSILPKPSFINPQIPPPTARLPGTGVYGFAGFAAQQERFSPVPDLASPGPRELRSSSGARGHGVHLLRTQGSSWTQRREGREGRDGGPVPGGRLC